MEERCGHCGRDTTTGMLQWVGERLGSRPLSINRMNKMYPPAAEARLHKLRHEWCEIGSRERRSCWVNHGLPVAIYITPLHADSDTPQDAGNCFPEVHAAFEGLRCAGVLAGTSSDEVVLVTYWAPLVFGEDGLRIEIVGGSGTEIESIRRMSQPGDDVGEVVAE